MKLLDEFVINQQSNNGSGGGGGVVPAVVKVVNVISDIGHGAQKVAKKVGKASQPLISHSAAQWRRTVDQHIMPGLNQGKVIHPEYYKNYIIMLGMCYILFLLKERTLLKVKLTIFFTFMLIILQNLTMYRKSNFVFVLPIKVQVF